MANTDLDSEYHVVCIAKDEAACLHEWIFHHLYFGFDKIFIYLNRITDDSLEVVNFISKKYPNVIFEIIDWVDWCQPSVRKNIQDIVYSYHFSKSKKYNFEVYTLYIDADEYWTPLDFKSTIKLEHKSIGAPPMVAYEWVLENGYNQPFVVLGESLVYRKSDFVKTLYKNSLTPKLFSAHKARLKNGYKGATADGEYFVAADDRRQGRVHSSCSDLKRSFLIHRTMKSEIEYLCSLVRSNPDSNFSIKMNRNGYVGQNKNGLKIDFDFELASKYQKKLYSFINECSLHEVIASSRSNYILKKYVLLQKAFLLGRSHPDDIVRVFKNIRDPEIILLRNYFMDKRKIKSKRKRYLFEYLREIAVSVEKNDLKVAQFFMSESLKLNPSGPFILKKIKEYDELLRI